MQRIFFSRRDMPDNTEEIEATEFTIRWEVSYGEGERQQIDAHSYDEIQELLQRKIETLLKERGGDVARIVQSSVHHKTKYEPFVSEITGDYKVVLYKLV